MRGRKVVDITSFCCIVEDMSMIRQLQNTTLNSPCKPCIDARMALEALDELERSLASLPNGLGLAANQIGLDCQVAIIRSPKHGVAIDLINPRIVKSDGVFINEAEACLSFPGRAFNVRRFGKVWVETSLVRSNAVELGSGHGICRPITNVSMPADAHFHPCEFSFCMSQGPEHYGGVICMAVQHEIDHLLGITIVSKTGSVEVPFTGTVQAVAGHKVGRNDPCPCGSGKKYKKCCGG